MLINILLALLIFFSYTGYSLWRTVQNTLEAGQKPSIEMINEINNGGLFKRDCAIENHFCMSNSDCIDICDRRFNCNKTKLICEPPTITASETTQDEIKCNVKHGSYFVLAVNQIVGELLYCVRTLANVFNQDEQMEAHVCSGGALTVDVTKKSFSPTDCRCGSGTVLTARLSDPNTPRCVPTKLLNILPSYFKL